VRTWSLTTLQEKLIEIGAKGEGVVIGVVCVTSDRIPVDDLVTRESDRAGRSSRKPPVPIAAGALYPFFGILLSPVFASAAMTLSSVSVIVNALRLRQQDLT
jgi:hypothetical protein